MDGEVENVRLSCIVDAGLYLVPFGDRIVLWKPCGILAFCKFFKWVANSKEFFFNHLGNLKFIAFDVISLKLSGTCPLKVAHCCE